MSCNNEQKGSSSTGDRISCDQFRGIKDEFNRELDAVNASAQKCASENDGLKSDLCALKYRLENAKNGRSRAEEEVRVLCKQLECEKCERDKEREQLCKDIECNDGSIQVELTIGYESKLTKLINDLRNQFKDKMCIASVDIVKDIIGSQSPDSGSDWGNIVEQSRDQIDQSIESNIKTISNLQEQLSKCTMHRDKIAITVDRNKREHEKNMEKIRRMQQELTTMLNQYQDLIDIKLLLDFELAAYNQMLVIEEYRLNVADLCQQDKPDNKSTAEKRKGSASSEDNRLKREK